MPKVDYLVLGSGIAGLSYALKCAETHPQSSVAIITKADASESNTKYAQGGIAVVTDAADTLEQHVEDTLRAGDGLCDEFIVRMVVTEGPERLAELIAWGAEFDREANHFHLGREGGHTFHRILHHKDLTGLEIERKLLERIHEMPNIALYSQHFALELITEHHLGFQKSNGPLTCYGAYVFNRATGAIETFHAGVTLLATGGAGQVYQNTTNPLIATGDGIAMAYRAKAEIRGLEFVQFHPTSLYEPGSDGPAFLLTEALRGHGAHLINHEGRRCVFDEDERGELASRDIVSRAIDAEMKRSGKPCVFLDARHLGTTELNQHFPTILAACAVRGIDMVTQPVPVVPAAHYLCGGVHTDAHGKTSIHRLLAAGECAHTGLHGANRLASNSLLEAVVFAHRCHETAVAWDPSMEMDPDIPAWSEAGTTNPKEKVLLSHNRAEIKQTMADLVGIVRTEERLRLAENRLLRLHEEIEGLYKRTRISYELAELRNLQSVAWLMVQQSLSRKGSAGTFFRE